MTEIKLSSGPVESRDLRGVLPANENQDPSPSRVGSSEGSPDAVQEPTTRATRRGLQFRERAQHGPVLVRIMRSPARCRWVNRAWLEFTGRELPQVLAHDWLEDVHSDDRARCAAISSAAFESQCLYRTEYRLRRADGQYAWILEIGTPRFTSQGRLVGFLGTAVEITEHVQARTRLALQYSIADVLAEARTLEKASEVILRRLCEELEWDVGELWLVDAKQHVPRCAQVWGAPGWDVSPLRSVAGTREFPASAGEPWQSGAAVSIANIRADAALANEPEARLLGLRGMFRLPVLVDGQVYALLRMFCRTERPRDASVEEFMLSIGVQIGQFLARQRSIEDLRESEARKAGILESSLDAVITIDADGLVVEFNSAAEKLFDYRRENVLGQPIVELIVPPSLREKARAEFARRRTRGGHELLGRRFEVSVMRRDGTEFPVELAAASIGTASAPLVTLYICDVTERKRGEQVLHLYQGRLRSLTADLLLTEEHERRRLAIDLHDGLSQTIALTQIKLSALRESLGKTGAAALDEIDDLIEQTNRAARSISFELSPLVLHDLGLEPALQSLAESIQSRYGTPIALADDGKPKPASEKTRVILFRAIRELLINAAKHADARRVSVTLGREGDELCASIEDDGVGMDPANATGKGFGLFSIHERLRHVGGSMQIASAPGAGTQIRLRAPLHHRTAGEDEAAT